MSTQQFRKGKCEHCDGPIEFDRDRAGEFAPCPHCSLRTVLEIYIPQKVEKSGTSLFGTILLAVTGILFVVSGCDSELSAKTAMHQTTSAIQYCTGWLLIAAALLLEALRAIAKNQ